MQILQCEGSFFTCFRVYYDEMPISLVSFHYFIK